ncbi:SCO6880 family protein [Nocardioides sp. YIM 152315]|uniref:SCO6880 family protein n=1 Tax=Nocardioides sp. YIM 152315 TaxID=3031760 RepID=UPI0023DB8EA6|nr:SCO6880 family protein [Nocardioides sp. YIM 152315]MDF1605894.1 PrgI family protein [Nocardioides sp. YIM 152315]
MGTPSSTETALTPVKFSRLSRRGILLGLSGPQLMMASCAAGTLILGLYLGTVLVALPVILLVLAFGFVGVGGRKLVEWAPIGARWLWRAAGGQLRFRRRILKPRPAGTLALPGDAARLRQWVDSETGAVMVHDPHAATLTAVVGVAHPAFVLLDPAEQERRVVGWGRVLATACRSGRLASVQVTERTLPDSGKGLADWWAQHGNHWGNQQGNQAGGPAGSWAASTYEELVDRAGPAGERHASTISISLDLKAARRAIRAAGGGNRGAAAVLRQEMATTTAALRAADLSPSDWLAPGDLALVLRAAYDPVVAGVLERHGDLGRDLAIAGPVAVTESWASLRSDSAHHCVLWISEWPRSLVFPGFLAPLLLSSGIRRTFTLLYTPMRTDRAARDIRKKKTEYISDAAQRQKIGQIEDAQQTAEYHDVLQQEADLTAGHGVLRTTGMVVVTAADPDELERSVAAVEQAAIQASCETRRLWGQQAQAFATAALPLCRAL